jgi:hypothetical protein
MLIKHVSSTLKPAALAVTAYANPNGTTPNQIGSMARKPRENEAAAEEDVTARVYKAAVG